MIMRIVCIVKDDSHRELHEDLSRVNVRDRAERLRALALVGLLVQRGTVPPMAQPAVADLAGAQTRVPSPAENARASLMAKIRSNPTGAD